MVSVVYWRMSNDLSLYVALQFGGVAALLLVLLLTRRGSDPFPWLWVVAWYGAANLAEAGDHALWSATNGLLAGHTLKHLAAAAAAAAVLSPLRAHAR